MKKIKTAIKVLSGAAGSEMTAKVILIAIAFVAGAAMITMFTLGCTNDSFKDGIKNFLDNMMNW